MLRPQSNLCRSAIELSNMWKIRYHGKEKPIAVSASWNEQYEDLFLEEGPLEYIYDLDVPMSWKNKRLRFYFGAVNTKSKVYLNDELIGSNDIGYLPFECDPAGAIKYGSANSLRVEVENKLSRDNLPSGRMPGFEEGGNFPPANFDFFPYGGIIRMPYVEISSNASILDLNFRCDRSIPSKKLGIMDVKVEVNDECIGKDIEVSIGDLKSTKKITSTKEDFHFEIKNTRFWELDDPYLYDLKAKIMSVGDLVDEYKLKVGIRTITLDDKHILLNGKSVKLLGFGKHEEFPVEGQGTFKPLIIKDYDLLKWIGANSFRTSHYPYSEEWLDMADELGFLVIDEAPHVGLEKYHYENPETVKLCVDDIRRLIDRDKNHPSVIMWSVANEPDSAHPKSDEFFKKLYDTAKDCDPTRPVTMVSCVPFCKKSGGPDVAMKHFDVISVNRYYGWYNHQGKIEEAEKLLSDDLDALRTYKRPVILTEFGADAISGFHANPAQMFSEEYQSEYIEKLFRVANEKDFVTGIHVWAFADFKTAQNIHRPLFNYKGVFTRDRNPKMAAHTLRKLWRR
ncbi:MAG: beta-glucuronidase [Caldisericum exile]|uniref:Beta-glucuronidase n=1 Tax=Caldisericum exile TaxID=693075 RepID=A0A2J6X9B6_9BACT|nr:MAG: beta-glucuronidase [Caldisericum exile]